MAVAGAEVVCAEGTLRRGHAIVGAPKQKRLALADFSLEACLLPSTSDALWACLLASCTSALTYRRPAFCCLDAAFRPAPSASIDPLEAKLVWLPRRVAQDRSLPALPRSLPVTSLRPCCLASSQQTRQTPKVPLCLRPCLRRLLVHCGTSPTGKFAIMQDHFACPRPSSLSIYFLELSPGLPPSQMRCAGGDGPVAPQSTSIALLLMTSVAAGSSSGCSFSTIGSYSFSFRPGAPRFPLRGDLPFGACRLPGVFPLLIRRPAVAPFLLCAPWLSVRTLLQPGRLGTAPILHHEGSVPVDSSTCHAACS